MPSKEPRPPKTPIGPTSSKMPVNPVMIPINWRPRKGSSTKKKCANTATMRGTAACSIATTALSTRLTATAVKTLLSQPFVVPKTIM